VGESTTYCGDRSYAYPRQLQDILTRRIPGKKFTVINKGKPGCSTAYIINQLEKWIEKYRPDMIVSMMGINDTASSHRGYARAGNRRPRGVDLRIYKVFVLLRRNIKLYLEKLGLSFPAPLRADLFRQKGYLGVKYDLSHREKELWTALRGNPGDNDSRIELGNCYLGQDRYEEAEGAFRKVLELAPDSSAAYAGLARVYLNRQHHKAVKTTCLKAIEINPANDEAWAVLGQSYMSKKKYGRATEACNKALEINPDNDQALSSLSWIYFWKFKKAGEARQFADRALKINPASYLANVTIWKIQEKRGDYQAAIETCLRIIEVDPFNQRAYLKLASLYEKTGRPELAGKYRRKERSLQLNTYNPITHDSYQKLRETAARHGLPLVAVQYPVRSVAPLRKMLRADKNIIFVDNEAVFNKALSRLEYRVIFKDNFAGDFGHCTAEGNRLLAENIAAAMVDPE